MNDRGSAATEVTDAWSSRNDSGAQLLIWLWLKQAPATWWSIHAIIHDIFGLTWMKVSEMESRAWGVAAIDARGQGDEDDAVWETCETWTPMGIDDALRAIARAYDASRAADWSSVYYEDFETRVKHGFDWFHALLGDL